MHYICTSNASNDLDITFSLAERVFWGNVLERCQAYVNATQLSFEGFSKFLEIVGESDYRNWITQYLRVYLNREKLTPYLKSGLISGDHSEDFYIAVLLSYYPKELIDNLVNNGELKPGMSFLDINDYFNKKFPTKRIRLTKKIKEENENLIYRARVKYLRKLAAEN